MPTSAGNSHFVRRDVKEEHREHVQAWSRCWLMVRLTTSAEQMDPTLPWFILLHLCWIWKLPASACRSCAWTPMMWRRRKKVCPRAISDIMTGGLLCSITRCRLFGCVCKVPPITVMLPASIVAECRACMVQCSHEEENCNLLEFCGAFESSYKGGWCSLHVWPHPKVRVLCVGPKLCLGVTQNVGLYSGFLVEWPIHATRAFLRIR